MDRPIGGACRETPEPNIRAEDRAAGVTGGTQNLIRFGDHRFSRGAVNARMRGKSLFGICKDAFRVPGLVKK